MAHPTLPPLTRRDWYLATIDMFVMIAPVLLIIIGMFVVTP